MVMLQASRLCFAVFLASLPSTQAAEGNSFPLFISHHYNNSLAYASGFINNTRCGWHCTIIDSDFPKHLKTVSVNDRLIKVVVEYEKKVTEQCARQTSRDSSGNGTDYFNVWLPANYKEFNFDHAVQRVLDLVTSSNTEERVNVKTACAFRPLRTSSAESVNSILNRDFLSQSVRSHLADHGFNVKRSNDCNAEISNLQSCIAMGNSTVNSTDSHLIPIWWDYGLVFLVSVFSSAFVYYSPAYICLFCPTVITERGLCQIVLEGASPVGFRSVVGNYIHSGFDTGHGGLMLVLRLVLLPLPLIPPAIVYYKLLQPVLEFPYLDFSKPFMIVPLFCYIVQAIYGSFFTVSRKMKPCHVCGVLKSDPNCDSEPRRRILNHLRVQPLILIKCWKFFRNSLVHYCKLSRAVFPFGHLGNMSFRCFFRVVGFLGFMCTIPVISVILFAAMLGTDLFGIIVTAPLTTLLLEEALVDANSNSLLGKRLPVSVRIFITAFSFAGGIGVGLISFCAAFGFGIVITIVFILLLSEQSLPFVVLFVLVCFYLWSSYSSFTNQYHDFSLILFKYYQEHQHDQVSKEAATATTADLAQHSECTPNPENECKTIKIPKQLFNIACEELMPIRESVCVLVLKVILILSFVFLAFAVVMMFHVGATPMMRALATFLTGSLPKIVTIYVDGARQRKLKAMMIKERAPIIVQRYLNRTGTYSGEVIIVDTKESIQLVNMETS